MKNRWPVALAMLALVFVALAVAAKVWASSLAQVSTQAGAPAVVSYQGQVLVNGQPFNGQGYFKFAVVDQIGSPTWSNAVYSGTQPAAAVALPVANGLFTVLLGDTSLTNMNQPLTYAAFGASQTYLRVWFSADNVTFQQLSPDRQIAAVPYALQAEVAKQADMVDGYHGSDFAFRIHLHSGQDITSPIASVALSGTYGNALVFSNAANVLAGNGSGLTGLNASSLTTGTVPGPTLSGTYGNALVLPNAGNAITGNGAGLTNLNASSLTAGTVPLAQIPTTLTGKDADTVDTRHANQLQAVVATSGYNTAAATNGTCTAYTSIAITVPGSGTVVVEANSYLELFHQGSNQETLTLAISGSGGDCGGAAAFPTRWQMAPSNTFLGSTDFYLRLSFMTRRTFSVTSGAHTYYINGQYDNTGTWLSTDMLATYYP
jgi:hypothetical protein